MMANNDYAAAAAVADDDDDDNNNNNNVDELNDVFSGKARININDIHKNIWYHCDDDDDMENTALKCW